MSICTHTDDSYCNVCKHEKGARLKTPTPEAEDKADELKHILGHCFCGGNTKSCWYNRTWASLENGLNDHDEKERLLEPLQEAALLAWKAKAVQRAEEQGRKEAETGRLLEWLEGQEAIEVAKFLGIIVYQYIMMPTNADIFKTDINGMTFGGKPIGDMHLEMSLAPSQDGGKSSNE